MVDKADRFPSEFYGRRFHKQENVLPLEYFRMPSRAAEQSTILADLPRTITRIYMELAAFIITGYFIHVLHARTE